jgi:hypothetical protein
MASYYEKHRDTICERAREYSRLRQQEQREYLATHPEEIESHREKMRDAYYKKRSNRIKRKIESWIKNETTPSSVKETLNQLLKDEKYKELKPAHLRPFEKLLSSATNAEISV